ncbi:MAG: DUF4340 domain-containing protein [Spirochaetales bacterium]|nr:DUF4340 domain-containing protein [Spirochaetales bacterium]
MMDYTKKIRRLVGVDVVLGLVLVSGILARGSGKAAALGERRELLKDPAAVHSIRVGAEETFSLSKAAGCWVLDSGAAGLPADAERVAAFLDALASVDRLEQVASSADSKASLGLTGTETVSLELTGSDGTVLLSLNCGAYAPSGSRVYLAFPGSDASYSAPAGFASYLKAGRKRWLDLRAFPGQVQVADIEEIRASGSIVLADGSVRSLSYTLRRSGGGWEGGTGVADPATVDAMARSLVSIKGDDWFTDGRVLGEPDAVIELSLGNSDTITLSLYRMASLYDLADDSYLAVSSERVLPLVVSAWTVADTFKDAQALAGS